MDKLLDTGSYGICLFSLEVLENFIKREKIKTRKLLQKLQKDKDLYLETQKEGIWLPVVGIAAYKYVIKLEGCDEPFDEEWGYCYYHSSDRCDGITLPHEDKNVGNQAAQ